ncbi:MAG: efflux RND transporter periplasmic adaptor subunit [Bryobacteraceae bacterium]
MKQATLATLVPALLLMAACGGEKTPKKAEAAAAPPVTVRVATAAPAVWSNNYEASGTVRARTTAVISAKVMGYVREMRVSVGDRVREGQVLATIDARDLEAEYRRAEAGQQEARAAIPEADNAVAAAKANMELAAVTFRRMDDLFKKKSVSNQEYDEASTRLKAARANYEMAVAKRSQVDARIAQAEQARAAAGVMRSYATIAAPFAGVVTAKQAEAGSMAAPGAPLLTLEREGTFRLEAQVEESRLPYIKLGQTAVVRIEALDRALNARVSEIVPAVDPGSRAYTVKLDLPPVPQIRTGVFGRAVFPMGTRSVIAVPEGAIQSRGQLQSVMVVDNGVARTRLVTLGQKSGGQVEVLSGLEGGEKIVFPLPLTLTDGARVEVRP